MDDRLRPQSCTVKDPLFARHVVEVDTGWDVCDLDREERRRECAGDSIAQADKGRRRPPDVDLDLLVPQWPEEAQPFHVVEMKVSEQQLDAPHVSPL